jgi:hypothetical protein
VEESSTEAGGWPVLESSPTGLTLRFIPSTPFGIGIVVRNRAQEALAIVDVHVVAPPQSLVHQIGTRLVPWNPPPCRGNHSCPAFGFLREPYTPASPQPLRVAAGKAAGVQLDFRLGTCGEVPFASPASIREVQVDYRYGNGAVRRQSLALGAAELLLRRPTAADCARRPHSHIAVSGEFSTSSDWTIPGSAGDTCTRTGAGGLLFRSRLYQSPRKPALRVLLSVARFHGLGLYRGGAQVRVIAGIGIHGWRTFRSRASLVRTIRLSRQTIGGRFQATLVGLRGTTFRAYGAWRCTRS